MKSVSCYNKYCIKPSNIWGTSVCRVVVYQNGDKNHPGHGTNVRKLMNKQDLKLKPGYKVVVTEQTIATMPKETDRTVTKSSMRLCFTSNLEIKLSLKCCYFVTNSWEKSGPQIVSETEPSRSPLHIGLFLMTLPPPSLFSQLFHEASKCSTTTTTSVISDDQRMHLHLREAAIITYDPTAHDPFIYYTTQQYYMSRIGTQQYYNRDAAAVRL